MLPFRLHYWKIYFIKTAKIAEHTFIYTNSLHLTHNTIIILIKEVNYICPYCGHAVKMSFSHAKVIRLPKRCLYGVRKLFDYRKDVFTESESYSITEKMSLRSTKVIRLPKRCLYGVRKLWGWQKDVFTMPESCEILFSIYFAYIYGLLSVSWIIIVNL